MKKKNGKRVVKIVRKAFEAGITCTGAIITGNPLLITGCSEKVGELVDSIWPPKKVK